MRELAERLHHCAKLAGGGNELGRKTGIARRTLAAYLSGESEPKASGLLAIADVAGVTLDWLIAGRGAAHAIAQAVPASAPAVDDDYAFIPLYDARVSAGHGAWNERAQVLTRLAFTRYSLRKKGLNPDRLSALRVDGDSNTPTLNDDDTLLMDHSRNNLQGEGLYVLLFDDTLFVKRVQRQFDGSVLIISENKAYPPMHLPADRVESLEIVGRAVWRGGWLL